MRLARLQDFRRRLRERRQDWTLQLDSFSFGGIPSLGEAGLIFQSPLTAISGPNGVGKTTLLRAIWECARAVQADTRPIDPRKLQAGTATLSFKYANESKSCDVTFGPEIIRQGTPPGVEVLHIDSASEVSAQQKLLGEFTDVEDLINGVGARLLEGKPLTTLNYLACRDYRSAQVYEVEGGNGVMPFFEVAFANDRYDSRTMGAGELALFFLWWSIERAPQGALVLIEEPECFLSPASQEALCNYLIEATVERQLTLVITSHSAPIISALSDENLVFIFRQAQGIKVVDGPPPPALLKTIGIEPPKDTIILVEDDSAEQFCRLLLERLRPSLARRAEISPRGGEGNIVAALRKVAGQFTSMNFIGLFDGDMRNRVPNEVANFCTLLPGDKPIEACFRDLVEADPNSLAIAIGTNGLDAILFGLQGKDHHDWYAGLCQELGMTKSQLFPVLFQRWIREEVNSTAAAATIDSLVALDIQNKAK